MPLILPGNVASATAAVGYDVANSCRFNSGDSPTLHYTPDASDVDKWTFSIWFKKSTVGTSAVQDFLSCIDGSGNNTVMNYVASPSNDTLNWTEYQGSYLGQYVANAKQRDPSAWYHAVFTWDSDNATAGNRMRIYINGAELTSFSTETNVSQDQDSLLNSNLRVDIGSAGGSSSFFHGYFAEVIFIDGSALTPTSFGEFDSDSPTIWKPKDPSGLTFGDNGFWLDFEDSSALGNDVSGNNNDLTAVNLDATDQATDTPTNNFCTLNPLTKWGGWSSSTGAVVLTQGNCHLNEATHASVVGTMATTNMKFYYEVKINAADYSLGVMGSQPEATSGQSYNDPTAYGYYLNGYNFTAGSWSSDSTFSGVAIYMFAVDPTNNKLWVGQNGTWDGDPAAGSGNMITLGTHEYMPYVHSSGTGGDNSADCNFGGCSAFTVSSANQDADGYGNFEYAVPSGFYALCTKNLAEYG